MNIQKGCYAGRTETGFPFSCPSGQDCYMLHLLREDGEYWIHDMHYPMKAGSGILISPGTSYLFYCSDGSCNDDWICFQPEKGETLPFSLVCNTPFQPDDFENCATLIRQLLKENNAVHLPPPARLNASGNINALFYVLLNHLTAACFSQKSRETISPYLQKFQLLRLQIQNSLSEEHTITRHAAEFCMSTSHFQHLYSQFFGVSFQNDLIQMRISHAEKLLQTTLLSMEQIAEACGYSNSTYFFRQFKKIKGISPARCRKVTFLSKSEESYNDKNICS